MRGNTVLTSAVDPDLDVLPDDLREDIDLVLQALDRLYAVAPADQEVLGAGAQDPAVGLGTRPGLEVLGVGDRHPAGPGGEVVDVA